MKKHIIAGIICCLLGSQGFRPLPTLADDEVQKTRSCQISTTVEWNIEEETRTIEGSLNYTVNGSLKLSEQMKKPISKMHGNLKYDVESLNMSYSYHERTTEKDPSFCRQNPVLEEWSGSGGYQFGGGEGSNAGLHIRNIGTMSPPMEMVKGAGAEQFLAMLQAQAPQIVTNYYEFFGFGPPPTGVKKNIVVSGRIRKNDCTFRDSTKKLFPVVSLRFKIPEDGKLKGEQAWSAKYDGGISLFSIGLSDLPETMEKKPYKPAKSANGDISYKVNWSFEEVKPEIRIYRISEKGEDKNKDITDLEEETIIGEKITLAAKALGLLDQKIENPEWKIDGKFIENYQADQAGTKLDKEVDLKSAGVSFAWTRGDFSGKPMQVEISGTIGGKEKEVTGKTTFKVFAPKIASRNVRCSPNVTLNERYNLSNIMQRGSIENISCRELDADPEKYFDNLKKHCAVYCGQVGSVCDPKKMERGITSEHTIGMPWIPEQGYALQYVQVIKEDYMGTNFDGTTKYSENKEWCIDTKYPYKRLTYPSISIEGESGQSMIGEENTDSCPGPWCRISMEDTPGIPLEQGSIKVLLKASLKHSFETYLMFRPSNSDSDKESLWVPLAMVTWGWSVDAERVVDWKENIPCNEAYQILNQSPPSKSGCAQSTNPEHPEWNCNVLKNDH